MASEQIPSPLVDLLRQYKLLQEEFEFEKETFYQQTQRAGIPKRIQQGVCWYPVSANKSYYNSLNQLIIEIKRDENDDTDHNFEYGRPVCFFRFDQTGDLRYFSFAATISYVHENTMLVVLPNSNSLLDIQGCPDLGVQLYFDGTSYKTMFSALTEVMEAKNNRLARLREAILGNEMVEQRKLQPIHLMWLNHSRTSGKPGYWQPKSCSCYWPSRNRKNNHARRGRLRNTATGESSNGLRPKQYCR